MSVLVKICGIRTPEAATAAIEGGADFIGFVFHPPSKRFIDPVVARYLASYCPSSVKTVGLFVNPSLNELESVLSQVRLDFIQLHGDETPDFCKTIQETLKTPVIRSFSVATRQDIEKIHAFADCAWRLLDAPPNGTQRGGTGHTFDWSLMDGLDIPRPWMLAGGLTPQNVGDAIKTLSPDAVDVSSGVESAPSEKDPDKIRAFIAAAKG
jgi:phosphoribosylanthranilate isomerase